ncbi:MAG: hypothetical protein HY716_02585 [Planctomycetes bacterium]|nr:hypothetical protein [Planctomycetota bacterium]
MTRISAGMFALYIAASFGSGFTSENQDASGNPSLVPQKLPLGKKIDVRVESALELEIITEDDKGTITRQLAVARSDSYMQESAPGDILRITCVSAKVQQSGTNRSPESKELDMQGQTYLVTRTAVGRTIQAEDGSPPSPEAAGVGAWEEVVRLLPPDGVEVKEGAAWSVDGGELMGLISVPDLPQARGRFNVQVESLTEGRATLLFSGSLEGRTPKGYASTLAVNQGRMVFDTSSGRPVSLSVTGSVEAAKDVTKKIYRPNEMVEEEEKIGTVRIKSRKLEVKVEFR